tara:strand:- start:2224 stop:3120 length:897 start_codon:yes stop_codon:yes gene_type:complete
MPDVPQHYKSRGITHWSPTKLNTPFWLVLAEYAYRLPKFFEARRDQRAGDPEADLRVQHYSKRGSVRMDAGSAVGEAAVRVINGEQTEREAVADTIARLQQYEPDGAADAALTANLLAEDASAVSKTLENTVIGLREIYKGANQVEAEERVEIEFPGVDVPSLGFSDVRGGGVITEIKTQWDKASNTKSGFSNNSVPTVPRDAHVLQIGHYHRRFGGTAKILYANRVNHRIFEIPTSHLNAAMNAGAKEARRRQRMLERTETVQAIMELCEPDWSHWMLRGNYSPELIGELRQVFYGD